MAQMQNSRQPESEADATLRHLIGLLVTKGVIDLQEAERLAEQARADVAQEVREMIAISGEGV